MFLTASYKYAPRWENNWDLHDLDQSGHSASLNTVQRFVAIRVWSQIFTHHWRLLRLSWNRLTIEGRFYNRRTRIRHLISVVCGSNSQSKSQCAQKKCVWGTGWLYLMMCCSSALVLIVQQLRNKRRDYFENSNLTLLSFSNWACTSSEKKLPLNLLTV